MNKQKCFNIVNKTILCLAIIMLISAVKVDNIFAKTAKVGANTIYYCDHCGSYMGNQASKPKSTKSCWKCTCSKSSCSLFRTKGSLYCTNHKNSGTYSSGSKSASKSSSYSKGSKSYSSKSSGSKKSSSSSKKKSSCMDSYDKGYEDVWLDDEYDWDRYYSDDDYAMGVDDAMDDEDW